MEKQVTLTNTSGLHARPASLFVTEANKYQSQVFIVAKGKRVNAKSILGLLSLALTNGHSFTIVTEGSDEKIALEALCKLVESGLGDA